MPFELKGTVSPGLVCFLAFTLPALAAGAVPEWLTHLKPDNPDSLCIAQQAFAKFTPGSPRQTAAFFELWDFFDASVKANQDAVATFGNGVAQAEIESIVRGNRPRAAKLQPWLQCGYRFGVQFGEDIFFDPDPFFLRQFEPGLKPEVREYLELFLHQSPYRLEDDGSLTLPPDALRARIGRWERFAARNGRIKPLADHVNRQLKYMYELYLCGSSNSEVAGPNGVEPGLRESYLRFLDLNKDSPHYKLMQQAVQILREHNWQISPSLLQLYRRAGVATDLPEQHGAR